MACGIRSQSSLRDSRLFGVQPSVETLGYSRLSFRDSKTRNFPSRQSGFGEKWAGNDPGFHHVFEGMGSHRTFPLGLAGAFATFSTLHAQTLNSGILEIGSSARWVNWFADFLPGQ